MEPGPELDRLVAEKVMGWTLSERGNWWMSNDGTRASAWAKTWSPSTCIEHAWQVVEQISEPSSRRCPRGFPVNTHFMLSFNAADLWAYNSTGAAHRICQMALAALKAVEATNAHQS